MTRKEEHRLTEPDQNDNDGSDFMERRVFIQGLLGLMVLPAMLAACASRAPVRIGLHPWIGYEPLRLAEGFGWLPPEAKLDVGVDALDTLSRLETGDLDGGALTLGETLEARSRGIPLTIVTVLNISAGADVVLTRPSIESAEQLRGRNIAVGPSAVGELMLVKLLRAAELTRDDVNVHSLRIDDQVEAWKTGRIDAAISYEPTASRLRRLGAVPVFDSRQIPDTIFDVLAMRRDRLDAVWDTLRDVVAAHFRSLEHMRLSLNDAVYRIAALQNISADEVENALRGVTLPGLEANRELLKPGSRLSAAAHTQTALMTRQGMLTRPSTLDDLLSPDLLPDGSATA